MLRRSGQQEQDAEAETQELVPNSFLLLLVTGATLVVTGALLVVTKSYLN